MSVATCLAEIPVVSRDAWLKLVAKGHEALRKRDEERRAKRDGGSGRQVNAMVHNAPVNGSVHATTFEESSSSSPSAWKIYRARNYIRTMNDSVAGNHGHNALFLVAQTLTVGFALTIEEAYPLICEYNERAKPPWDDRELRRKLEQAVSRSRLTPGYKLRYRPRSIGIVATPTIEMPPGESLPPPVDFVNFRREEVVSGETTRIVKIGLPVRELLEQLYAFTSGWPMRWNDMLFAQKEDGSPQTLKRPNDLFAWLRGIYGDNDGRVVWEHGSDMTKESELHAYMQQNVPNVRSIEIYPHEPPLEGTCYMHQAVDGGDGRALAELMELFTPASPEDYQLIKAFLMTIVWGGAPGERPAWMFVGEDSSGASGRGVGKSTVAKIASKLVGGAVSITPDEHIRDIQVRLLSDKAIGKRVVIIDNIKSLRFSNADIEGLMTVDTISGRQLNVGEGSRPNDLTWVLTFNAPSLSKDFAQRCVTIRIAKPFHSPEWKRSVDALIRTRRWAIIGDLMAKLRKPPVKLAKYTRWSLWEDEVLSKLPNAATLQAVIAKRAEEVDDDDQDKAIVRDAFVGALIAGQYDHESGVIVFSPQDASAIYNRATGERKSVSAAMKSVYIIGIEELSRERTKHGAKCVWRGKNSTAQSVEQTYQSEASKTAEAARHLDHFPARRRRNDDD